MYVSYFHINIYSLLSRYKIVSTFLTGCIQLDSFLSSTSKLKRKIKVFAIVGMSRVILLLNLYSVTMTVIFSPVFSNFVYQTMGILVEELYHTTL